MADNNVVHICRRCIYHGSHYPNRSACYTLGIPPFLIVVLLSRYLWRKMTYTIDDNVLSISAPLKSLVIGIDSIKKIQRGKYWVERGRNYSATYIKLRIIYDRTNYIYVSPEDEKSFVDTLQALNPNIEYSSERGL